MDGSRRFHDLVRAGAALNYPTHCRLVVDEVIRRYGSPTDPADRGGARSWAWLEEELGAAGSTPGTTAERLRPLVVAEAETGDSPAELRSWAWRRLGSPDQGAWRRGSESRSIWSLLMSPLPADEDEVWWLASSNGLEVAQIRALLDPIAPPEPPRSGAKETA